MSVMIKYKYVKMGGTKSSDNTYTNTTMPAAYSLPYPRHHTIRRTSAAAVVGCGDKWLEVTQWWWKGKGG